jgi:hypothetical protein
MEFGFASDRTNNAYFDRVIQMGVDNSISEISYCLQVCRIAARAHLEPRLSFPQKACLRIALIIQKIAPETSVSILAWTTKTDCRNLCHN